MSHGRTHKNSSVRSRRGPRRCFFVLERRQIARNVLLIARRAAGLKFRAGPKISAGPRGRPRLIVVVFGSTEMALNCLNAPPGIRSIITVDTTIRNEHRYARKYPSPRFRCSENRRTPMVFRNAASVETRISVEHVCHFLYGFLISLLREANDPYTARSHSRDRE